jgi:ribosome biogenesis GTPase A
MLRDTRLIFYRKDWTGTVSKEPEQINHFSWYPGHIAKAEAQLKEKIKIIDIVIELRDARIPLASTHQDLRHWAENKLIITVLTKADLADPAKTSSLSEKQSYICFSAKDNKIPKALFTELEKLSKPIIEKFRAKGVNMPIKVVIAGYPNVGKSTLINKLSKSKKAKVENRPGVTKEQQWINMHEFTIKNPSTGKSEKHLIKLLDTPGIIPSKFYSNEQALKLALCGCIGEKAFDHLLAAEGLINLLEHLYPGLICRHYYGKTSSEDKTLMKADSATLEELAIAMNLSQRQGKPDVEKAALKLIQDFREAKLGRISLD